MKCPNCGKEVEKDDYLKDGYSFVCKKCGCSVDAMFTEEIDEDETIYEIIINDEIITKEKIKALANLINVNYLEANKLLSQKQVVSKNLARITLNIKIGLEKASISYVIKPNFNW